MSLTRLLLPPRPGFRAVRRVVLGLGAALGLASAASAADAVPPGRFPAPPDPLCTMAAYRAPHQQSAGTLRMVARLERLRRDVERRGHSFANDTAVRLLRARLAGQTNAQEVMTILPQLGTQLLYAGQSEAALKTFNDYAALARRLGVELSGPHAYQLQHNIALANLRIGEQENCLTNHTTESCLFPIQAAGVHKATRGSRGAIEALRPLLEQNPGDLRSRWLLNIAHMTLGEYPDKVDPRWRIPPSAFASEHDPGRFPDIAGRLGLDASDLAGGVVAEDFDRDGFLDLLVSRWGQGSQLRLYHNQGDNTFAERTYEAGLTGLYGGLNMVQADYNNDGFADVYILRGAWLGPDGAHPDSLLRNNGDGTFDDVTEEAGLLALHPSQTAAWFDYNADGWIDLFVGNESTKEAVHPSQLFRNNGNGTFTECAAQAGLDLKLFVKGVACGDYNNDGRPDLYLSIRDGPNHLFRNDGPAPAGAPAGTTWIFTDTTAAAGVAEPIWSFPTWFFDYDNDGWLDLFVSAYFIQSVADVAADVLGLETPVERARLYRNRGDGTFEDVTKAAGLHRVLHTMGSNFGDLDNDGWLDFYLATGDPDFATLIPNRMFRNDAGRRFQDVTTAGGFGHLQKGHAVAFADLDNDGDQDVYTVIGGAATGDVYRNVLFHNPGHGNHWVSLQLEGDRSNRAAIGARIKLTVATKDGERVIHRVVNSGGSFGANPLRHQIGLGPDAHIKRVEIQWPTTGLTQDVKGVEADRFFLVREGESDARPLPLRKLDFDKAPARPGHHHAHPPSG